MLSSSDIVRHLETELGIDGRSIHLKSAIEQVLVESSESPLVAAERAEKLFAATRQLIDERDQELTSSGGIPILRLQGASSDLVSGSCFVLNTDEPMVASAKATRIFAADIQEQMRDLSFSEFELFGRRVLQQLGADNAKVTASSNDQGIDFYGEISVAQFGGLPEGFFHLSHNVRFTIVGQAKHYPKNKIGPNLVRELIGAMSLSRTRTFSNEKVDLFDGVSVSPFGPLLAVFFSTGEFTSGAKELARKAGLIVFSGSQLATYLADNGVGVAGESDGGHFDQAVFRKWLFEPNPPTA